ncbi:MAG: hypothetical protein RR505_08745 [Raoultibacter sp.]
MLKEEIIKRVLPRKISIKRKGALRQIASFGIKSFWTAMTTLLKKRIGADITFESIRADRVTGLNPIVFIKKWVFLDAFLKPTYEE